MDAHALLEPLARLHDLIGQGVVTACASRETRDLAAVASDEEGDTIYEIDRVSEAELLAGVAELAALAPIVLVAEGIGERVLPDGTAPDAAVWRVIVDPIDGTRGLMYQKRSGWILTAVAPERGPATRLSDVVLAVQTEIPLLKQHLYDRLWAVRGDGAHGERHNRLTGTSEALALRPSTATDLAHGFGQVARFFPGGRDVLAAIDDEIAAVTAGEAAPGKARCYEDQYVSSAGQLYELIVGHDRFVADLRPLLRKVTAARGEHPGICSHPYDLATALIAEEAGVVLTDPRGGALDFPLDLDTDVGWVGYANDALRRLIEPVLHDSLIRRNLLGHPSSSQQD
jgi:hypothetical protein